MCLPISCSLVSSNLDQWEGLIGKGLKANRGWENCLIFAKLSDTGQRLFDKNGLVYILYIE